MFRTSLRRIKELTDDALLKPCNRVKNLVEIQKTVAAELNCAVFTVLTVRQLKQVNEAILESRKISRALSEWISILKSEQSVSRQLINTRLSKYLEDVEKVSGIRFEKLTTEDPEEALKYCIIIHERVEHEIETMMMVMDSVLSQLNEKKVQFHS